MSDVDEKKSPLKRFQEMLGGLLSVPKAELDKAIEAEKQPETDESEDGPDEEPA